MKLRWGSLFMRIFDRTDPVTDIRSSRETAVPIVVSPVTDSSVKAKPTKKKVYRKSPRKK